MYIQLDLFCTGADVVQVAITDLRRELKHWLDRARAGEEVVVTERGRPIVRLTGVDVTPVLDRLRAEGVIGPAPDGPRPRVRGRPRIRPEGGDVSSFIIEERDRRR